MNKQELIQKIIQKKEFSQLPEKDVELAFSHFEKRQVSDEEKIRLTRELLHKVFSSFTSSKLLSPKNKDEEWILRKHLSTRERLPFYSELYEKLLEDYKNKAKTGNFFINSPSGKSQIKKISIIDLGAGVNGFSYKYFENLGFDVNYIGVEAVGQLVEQMNNYFSPKGVSSGEKNQISGKAIHESLFELEKIKKIITENKKPRIIFLFKVLDSLEMLERDYSKKLLMEITSLADKVIVSFATMSMIKRKKFKVERFWILDFIKDNFEILDELEIGGERYISFRAR